jgi:hypothetical protein
VGFLVLAAREEAPRVLEGLLEAGEDAFVCGELA